LAIWRTYNINAAASTGFGWNRLTDQNLGTNEGAKVWVADISLGWFPVDLVPSIAVRYQHVQQFGATAGQTTLRDFGRNIISLTMGYHFPARPEPKLSGTAPQRVDRTDGPEPDAQPAPRKR